MNDNFFEDRDMEPFSTINLPERLRFNISNSVDGKNLKTSCRPISSSNGINLHSKFSHKHMNSFSQVDCPKVFDSRLNVTEDNLDALEELLKYRSSSPTSSPISKRPKDATIQERPVTPDNASSDEIPYEYINPFTPDGKMMTNKVNALKKIKRLSISSTSPKSNPNDSSESFIMESKMDVEIDLPNRVRLSQFNVSRFTEEFIVLSEIGKGVHGCVYKCLNRMNGCIYAVKRTLNPIKSDFQERVVRNEIYAHGILNHPNIVRNFSCWTEDGFVFIQNEYCRGGSLEDYIKVNVLSETLLKKLLSQMAEALRYIHKKELAHMDIKPGNIFISIDKNRESFDESDGGSCESDKLITFKLGDFGHIVSLDEVPSYIEEGDCRYLAREVIEGNLKYLDKADIFSLGLTVFEASGGGPLPKNGEQWHDIRNGNLQYFKEHSRELVDILKAMIHPSPEKRPSADEVIEMLKPNIIGASLDDVCEYIQHYQHNNNQLEQRYEATDQYLRTLFKSHKFLQEQLHSGKKVIPVGKDRFLSVEKKKGSITKTRVIGRKTRRSNSTVF